MHMRSMANNQLCGVRMERERGQWVQERAYTAEGITVLCEGLKGNTSLKELKCAAAFTPGSPDVSAR